MNLLDLISGFILSLGGLFFFAGTIGLLRFRDAHSRLHALSKADNLGLGLICVGLILRSGSVSTGVKIFFIWLLALFASAVTCYIIAEWELNLGKQD